MWGEADDTFVILVVKMVYVLKDVCVQPAGVAQGHQAECNTCWPLADILAYTITSSRYVRPANQIGIAIVSNVRSTCEFSVGLKM